MKARPSFSRPSLRQVLRRPHLMVTLSAVGVVGLVLIVIGLIALRGYADHHQKLIARSIAYAVEAALVFHDRDAAQDILTTIGANEDVRSAVVYDDQDDVLAAWHRTSSSRLLWLQQQFDHWLTPAPVRMPVVYRQEIVGHVLLVGQAAGLLSFLLKGLAGVFACIVMSGIVASWISQHAFREVLGFLRRLADVAHAVRNARTFDRRIPPARIAELHALSEDFNALLDELETWQHQWQRENASLAHKASHDSLTGLSNRAHFEEQLSRAIHQAVLLNQRVVIMFLDADRFKAVNDRLGHAAGDAVLVSMAARVRSLLREGDLVARLGGDEFGIMLSTSCEAADAQAIAEEILLDMQTAISLPNGTGIVCSLSIGIAIFPDHAENASDLFDAADVAMYRAKRWGGGTQAMADLLEHYALDTDNVYT